MSRPECIPKALIRDVAYGKVAGDVINGKRLFAYKALLSSLGPMDRPENRGFYLIIGLGF